jgi:hypothetical protein
MAPSVCTTAHSIRNSIETKAENNILEAKQYPAIQRNLTENTIDSGTQSKTRENHDTTLSWTDEIDVEKVDLGCAMNSHEQY